LCCWEEGRPLNKWPCCVARRTAAAGRWPGRARRALAGSSSGSSSSQRRQPLRSGGPCCRCSPSRTHTRALHTPTHAHAHTHTHTRARTPTPPPPPHVPVVHRGARDVVRRRQQHKPLHRLHHLAAAGPGVQGCRVRARRGGWRTGAQGAGRPEAPDRPTQSPSPAPRSREHSTAPSPSPRTPKGPPPGPPAPSASSPPGSPGGEGGAQGGVSAFACVHACACMHVRVYVYGCASEECIRPPPLEILAGAATPPSLSPPRALSHTPSGPTAGGRLSPTRCRSSAG
jgi:hypothetical protein